MILALAMVGLLATGQAQALTPIPECVPEGAERAAGVGEYTVAWHGGGFVLYTSWDVEYRLFLDDCKGQRRLMMQSARQDDPTETAMAQDALYEAVSAALESKQRYTMGQIRAIARATGARTKLGKASYVSCGCDRWGDEG
jgi:hypothetical protein